MPRAPEYDDKTDEAPPSPRARRGRRMAPVLEPNEARQGVTHHNVRFMLAIGLGVAVLVLAVVYVAFFSGGVPT